VIYGGVRVPTYLCIVPTRTVFACNKYIVNKYFHLFNSNSAKEKIIGFIYCIAAKRWENKKLYGEDMFERWVGGILGVVGGGGVSAHYPSVPVEKRSQNRQPLRRKLTSSYTS
jgi:hypothetical protein